MGQDRATRYTHHRKILPVGANVVPSHLRPSPVPLMLQPTPQPHHPSQPLVHGIPLPMQHGMPVAGVPMSHLPVAAVVGYPHLQVGHTPTTAAAAAAAAASQHTPADARVMYVAQQGHGMPARSPMFFPSYSPPTPLPTTDSTAKTSKPNAISSGPTSTVTDSMHSAATPTAVNVAQLSYPAQSYSLHPSDTASELALRSDCRPATEAAAIEHARAAVANAQAQARAQIRGARFAASSTPSSTSSVPTASTRSAASAAVQSASETSSRKPKSQGRAISKSNRTHTKSAQESQSDSHLPSNDKPLESRTPEDTYDTKTNNSSSGAVNTSSGASPSIPRLPTDDVRPKYGSLGSSQNYSTAHKASSPSKENGKIKREYESYLPHQRPPGVPKNPANDEHGQLSPEQLFVNMKEMIMVHMKNGQASRNQGSLSASNASPQGQSNPAMHVAPHNSEVQTEMFPQVPSSSAPVAPGRAYTGVNHCSKGMEVPLVRPISTVAQSAQNANTVDVETTTYQLAGARIASEDVCNGTYPEGDMMRSSSRDIIRCASRDMDVMGSSLPMSASFKDSAEMNNSANDDNTRRKQRADDIDKVLNSAGSSAPLMNNSLSTPVHTHSLDHFRPGNGRLPASLSRSFSFLRSCGGGPLGSREGSMEFRKGHFGSGVRDMSVELLKRDFSMELMQVKKIGSQEPIGETELPRDMSIDCFGSSFRTGNRDMSIEMQLGSTMLPRGASVQFGTFGDDGPLSFAFHSAAAGLRDDHSKDASGHTPDGRLTRSRIVPSADDLMIHVNSSGVQVPVQTSMSQYRRGMHGSIEDFRDIKHPF